MAAASAILPAAASKAAVVSHLSPAIGATPMISAPQTPQPGSKNLFDCQSKPLPTQDRCYSPLELQQAYGFSGLLAKGVNGSGKTIVIVEAFDNPYIQQDLAIEDSTFGLPPPPSFTVVDHAPSFDITNGDEITWAAESSLDVLSAHAMAPGANIVLVEAASDSDADLYAAEKYAVDNNLGDVMSQSFGGNEACVDPSYFQQWQNLFQTASAQGWTFFASTGDAGAAQFSCDGSAVVLAAGWPAVDPYVTAVGGTTLDASDPSGNYRNETAWTDPAYGCSPPAFDPADVNCSGGGFSTIFAQPTWQTGLVKTPPSPPPPPPPPPPPGPKAGPPPKPAPPPPPVTPMRGIPDVSYDAGVNGGLLIHLGVINELFGIDPSDPTVFFTVGGTSAGSPQWAALAAEADQLASSDLGAINANLYALAQAPKAYAVDFNDPTHGNNDVVELGGAGYKAGPGWDPVTGLGSPRALSLVPALAGVALPPGHPPPPPPPH